MAGILLFVLKLIGWILLSLLILLLLLVALVLFLPIPYHLRLLAKEGEPFLFTVRVFGFQVYPKRERKSKRKRTEKKSDGQELEAEWEVPDKPEQTTGTSPEPEQKAEQVPEPASEPKDTTPPAKEKLKHKTKKSAKDKKERGLKRQKLQSIHRELIDEGNHRALAHVLSEAAYLLRHFGPRKVKGEVSFSLGDPANTGYATAALSLCPFAYNGCGIYPDFESEKMYVTGELDVRGHVRLVHALHSGLGLLLDKDIRKFIHKVRN
jgi:hypothetical protein